MSGGTGASGRSVLSGLPARGPGRMLFIVLLYVMGVMHWAVFYNSGRMSFAAEDWPKEYAYYSVLRSAMQQRVLPYHTTASFQNTDRFLALPETNLSPQIALLPYLSTGRFILFNTLLLYSLGFAGCLLLRAKYALSLLPFSVLFLLFNFNGHITSHLAVGHSMWGGYFLLPFYFLAITRLAERPAAGRGPLLAALTMFAILLQGSFHLFVWCLMFTAFIALFNPSCRRAGWYAVGCSLLLASFRLVPAAVAFMGRKEPFVAGYPTLTHLVESFIVLHEHGYRSAGGIFGAPGWWEFDLYTGLTGFLFLLYFGVYRGFVSRGKEGTRSFTLFALPALLLTVFSLSYFYAFIASLPLPLAGSERVSARFVILPFFVLLVAASVRLEEMRSFRAGALAGFLSVTAVLEMLFSLATHSWHWRIAGIEAKTSGETVGIVPAIVQRTDRWYELSVQASALLSFAALLVVSLLAIRSFKNHTADVSAPDREAAC